MQDKDYTKFDKADKQRLMKRLQICSFVLVETAMYLDTHPKDKEALSFYNKHLSMQKETREEYVEKYGPLSLMDKADPDTWKWVDAPWPWELEVE